MNYNSLSKRAIRRFEKQGCSGCGFDESLIHIFVQFSRKEARIVCLRCAISKIIGNPKLCSRIFNFSFNFTLLEQVSERDREYFEENPDEVHRVREPYRDEVAAMTLQRAGDIEPEKVLEIVALEGQMPYFISVLKMRQGVRSRLAIDWEEGRPLPEGSDLAEVRRHHMATVNVQGLDLFESPESYSERRVRPALNFLKKVAGAGHEE